ncbi:MAG: hypothetical protein U0230_20675 [Polyangiales bacterium]
MPEIRYELELVSDAEPGTGLGTELVDDLLPRDERGRPTLRASHLKGLVRDLLEEVVDVREWDRARLVEAILGRPGEEGDDGVAAGASFTDAKLVGHGERASRTITRTALADTGVAHDGTLRTSEALAAGSKLRGSVHLSSSDPAAELAIRLALASLAAVGGGRNRGSGACLVRIDGETRSPGALLRELARAVARPAPSTASASGGPRAVVEGRTVWLRLELEAEGPVLCPEQPIGSSNALRSGLAIPASAVQGILLTRLSTIDDALASALFAHPAFRCWPLHPMPDGCEGIPVRTSRTHRMTKLPDERGVHRFEDELVAPYDWRTVPAGAPLKSADGILARATDGGVVLYRGADMPRVISAHAVHAHPSGSGERGLFTAECLAPMRFAGVVAIPLGIVETLVRGFESEPWVAVGKSRSVRGSGRLRLAPIEGSEVLRAHDGGGVRILVVQSPIALPDTRATDLDVQVRELVREAGWGEVEELHLAAGIRFGWNRKGLGRKSGGSNRLRATRVLLPGTVIKLRTPLASAEESLVRGLGGGRDQGFGALLPHPGRASRLHVTAPPPLVERRSDARTKLGIELFDLARSGGPSASQIARLAARVRSGTAEKWLQEQSTRNEAQAARFRPVARRLESLLKGSREELLGALRVWQDFAIADREEEDRR